MAEQSKMKVESLRRSVEDKLGVTREAFDKVVLAKKELVKKNNPDANESVIEKKVYLLVKSEYKKQLLSPAMNFEGVVVSWGRPFDLVAQMRSDAREAMKKSDEQAVAEGYVDDEGFPLDTREAYKSGSVNRNYGKRLPKHEYIRNLIGVCIHEETPKLFRLVLNGRVSADKPATEVLKTELVVPMYTPMEFRANVAKTQRDERFLQLNQSKSTDFKSSDADIDVANVMASELLDPFRVRPEEVGDYFDAHATQAERLVVMEGVVTLIGEEAGDSGDVLVVIDSEEGDFDFMGVRCWVPEYLREEPWKIEEGDEVTVMGQANRGKFGDEEVDMVNVTGIYSDKLVQDK